jgi:DNA-binding XRE family transcriptional regulator
MVADLLAFDGWEVDFLGANTPTRDLVSFVRDREPDLVALSVTGNVGLPHAARAISALRDLPRPPRVLLGGLAVRTHPEAALAAGADALVDDGWAAVERARSLVGLTQDEHDLSRLLGTIGAAIRELRRARGLTQQQLGEAADLDRSYVSAVEQGRQNLSLGAILRLAHALDVPLNTILFPDRSSRSSQSARPPAFPGNAP